MKKALSAIFLCISITTVLHGQVTVSGSSGANGSYTRLGLAFAAINSTAQTGNTIVVTLDGNTTETSSAVLNAGAWTSLTIYPVSAGLSVTATLAAPLVDLNGADNVIIDGRVGATGSVASLTIANLSTATTTGNSTIRLRNGATNNIVRYCNLEGSTHAALSGIIFFNTTSTTGNNNNTIDNNNITTAAPPARPFNAVYSQGGTGNPNSGNTISNNNIYDFFNFSSNSYGIFLNTNNAAWTISGNSFYETATLSPNNGYAYNFIRIASGDSHSITGNFLGGSSANCGGSAFSKAATANNPFVGIYLSISTAAPTNIQNNTISNINWSNSGATYWAGMDIPAGAVNIGTTTGNTIGATSGNGSITVTNALTSGANYNFFGIRISSAGAINCSNNLVAAITTANAATNATNILGIDYSGAGTATFSDNTIGSSTTPNSIFASSGSTGNPQYVTGINNTGNGTVTISGNTIANLTNGSSNTSTGDYGQIRGIASTRGTNTITGNNIHHLSNSNANTLLRQTASVVGIALAGTTSHRTVSGNTIYSLSNTYGSFTGGVIGIYFDGSTAGNDISLNHIYNLSVSGSSRGAALFGIRIASGASSYYNNVISLSAGSASTLYGFYEEGASGNNNHITFNTVYIGGSSPSGSYSSYAIYNNTNTNIRTYDNNIFSNFRSNSGGTGRHYAIRLQGTTNLTIDYNDYFVSGSGGTLGSLTIDRTSLALWQAATGQDVHSHADNPVFTSPGGTSASDYRIGAELRGVVVSGISTDYGGTNRDDPPTMGAWENPLNKWRGSAPSALWSVPTNWTLGVVPAADANIIFDAAPLSDCVMDGDRSVTNITNATTRLLVTNGHKLTIKGTTTLTNGAAIEASVTGSAVEYAGTTSQVIPAATFLNNRVYNFVVNNASNITLTGSLNILNNITATAGLMDATSASPTIIFGGTAAQTFPAGVFLNETLSNLTSDNTAGLTLNGTLTVLNSLTVNTARSFILGSSGILTVNSVVNNGLLTLRSTSPSDNFSLIMENYSGTGTATAQMYLTGGGNPNYNWHYVAVPQNNLSKTIFTNINAFNLLRYNDSRVVTSDFNGWEWHDGYASSGIAGGTGFTTLDIFRGYNFYNGSDVTVQITGLTSVATTMGNMPLQYSGTVNNSPIFGYNLFGNSLTCSLDWDNVALSGNMSYTVYYTTGNKWATYLTGAGGTNGGTNMIPPLQGFFAKANATGAFADFSGARVHASQPRYKKSSYEPEEPKGSAENPRVKLELTGPSTSDETIVWLNEQATTGFDEQFDAYKLFSSEALFGQLYSTTGGASYVINGLPFPSDSSTVPLGIKIAEAGSYTLLKKDFIAADGYEMWLIDLYTGTTENLGTSSEYTFTSEPGTYTDRFVIKIKAIFTGIEEPVITASRFNLYSVNGIINVVPLTPETNGTSGEIKIYDLNGRVITHVSGIIWEERIPVQVPLQNRQGIFMVEALSGKIRHVGKIYLR